MSDTDELNDKLSKAVRTANKNINVLIDMVKGLEEKLNANKPERVDSGDREKVNSYFEKRQIGRPAGDYGDKQTQYLRMMKEGKIKQPKKETIENYKIMKIGNKYNIIDID